ncbi:4'-phosphopantetheine phosphatase isoform X1 [Euwallacea fornicatus]|uniref:4'-phosphopantetheine phosphatase isoform X1 n=1 Tax=Euwallacea fornicatus TaxID=995702 RepID=UPI00338E8061
MNNRICPLLKDPENYTPDIQDLLSNEVERNYWLATLERTVAKFVDKAGELNPDNPKATEDAKSCLQKFQQLIEKIKSDPRTLIPLNVRTLLDFNEENLRVHFKDAWRLQKETETRQALTHFRERIDEIDLINDFNEKWLELIKGVLAGNVFDWGSEAVAKMLAEVPTFGLSHAMDTIEERPWFIDHVNLWIERLNSHTFKSAVIFVDNAGVDFVLGILPFIRELLTMGTRVILTANSYPSLNDVTYQELNLYCCSAAQQCNVLKDAISSGQLVTIENGQKGPCLDLKNIPSELCDLMVESDLIVLEGMGRSVHTNLNTEFAVDSIKIAVLKNEWLAKSLGANQFSVIFKYEPAV